MRLKYKGWIYKVTNNINGKSYIGQTNDYKRRWNEHKWGKGNTAFLNKAIKKYGIANFTFSILIELKAKDDKSIVCLMDALEMYYIHKYNTFKKGYNATEGGRGVKSLHFSKESIEKMKRTRHQNILKESEIERKEKYGKGMRGKHHTKEIREIITQALLHRPREIYDRIAAKRRGKKRDHDMIMRGAAKRRKPVLQYNLNGDFIKEYDGVCNVNWVESPCNISACCRGKSASAYGYIWRYKKSENFPKKISPYSNKKHCNYTNNNVVCKCDLNGNVISAYETITEAANKNHVSRKYLNYILVKGQELYKGFKWCFRHKERRAA